MPQIHYVKRKFLRAAGVKQVMKEDAASLRKYRRLERDRKWKAQAKKRNKTATTSGAAPRNTGGGGTSISDDANDKNNTESAGDAQREAASTTMEQSSRHLGSVSLSGASAAAGLSHLQRKGNHLVLVQLDGTREKHQAYELQNPDNPDTGYSVWVEWLNGTKCCISRHEIVRYGLPARERKMPNKFADHHFR